MSRHRVVAAESQRRAARGQAAGAVRPARVGRHRAGRRRRSLFIYRDEVYDKDTDEKGVAEHHRRQAAQRPDRRVALTFLGSSTRFENYVSDDYADGAF